MYDIVMLMISNEIMFIWYIYDEWTDIDEYYKFHIQHLSIWSHFTQFICI